MTGASKDVAERKPLKVLHVFYGKDIVGGGSYSMLYLCEGLAVSKRFEVQAVVPRTKEKVVFGLLSRQGIKAFNICLPWIARWRTRKARIAMPIRRLLWPIMGIIADKKIARIIETEDIDVVHIGGAVIDAGLRPALRAGKPVIWHLREYVERDHDMKYLHKQRAFQNYAKASCCICVSESLADYYRQELPNTRIESIYNGILSQHELDKLSQCRRTLYASGGVWKMVFLGGVRETKGTYELLSALVEFRERNKVDFRLDIYGSASSEDKARLTDLLANSGLADCVEYKGWVKIDSRLLRKYDISFTCSRSEAFGRVTAEAMCNRVLVIGANAGGTAELIGNGRGILYQAGNSADLARSIERVVTGNIDYYDTIENAFSFAYENFSREAYVAKVCDIYREVLEKSKTQDPVAGMCESK